jgi:hypothetical protein
VTLCLFCFNVNDEVKTFYNVVKPSSFVVGDDVAVAVPELPQLLRIDAGVLDLIQKTVVNCL